MKLRSRRSLQISNSGRWYILLSIVFGVVAISSGNNVLYLLESLLLGGMILSGVLSERTVTVVFLQWRRKPVMAESPTRDSIVVTNRSRFPVFCVQVGEWRKGQSVVRAFVPYLGAMKSVTLTPNLPYQERGEYRWEGFFIATPYPFGFANKIRWVDEPGRRLVWPRRISKSAAQDLGAASSLSSSQWRARQGLSDSARRFGGGEYSEGEVRPLQPGDDYRDIVWSVSAFREEYLVRQRVGREPVSETVLDTRLLPGPEFERRVSETAEIFYQMGEGVLLIRDWQGVRRYDSHHQALDALAMVQASGLAGTRRVG